MYGRLDAQNVTQTLLFWVRVLWSRNLTSTRHIFCSCFHHDLTVDLLPNKSHLSTGVIVTRPSVSCSHTVSLMLFGWYIVNRAHSTRHQCPQGSVLMWSLHRPQSFCTACHREYSSLSAGMLKPRLTWGSQRHPSKKGSR